MTKVLLFVLIVTAILLIGGIGLVLIRPTRGRRGSAWLGIYKD